MDVYTNMQMNSFIDVPTWHGQQIALEILFFRLYIHFIGKRCQWFFKKIKPPLFCMHQVVVTTREPSSRLGVLSIFSPISLHNLLHVMGDGFKSYFPVFSSKGSPLCILEFWVWSFVWTLVLSFFFSCSLVGRFPFIYLFMN